MGFIAVSSNNIWPAIILHFTNNFINVYIEFASVKNLPLGNLDSIVFGIFSQNLATGLILSSLIIFFVVFGIVYLVALLYKPFVRILRKIKLLPPSRKQKRITTKRKISSEGLLIVNAYTKASKNRKER